MFDKLAQFWRDTEEKLPGFRYVTAVFLILAVLGYAVIKYKGIDYWWVLIPGFFLVLLFVLFVWLIFTLITAPPAPPGSETEWMRRFLSRFVLFLFVLSVLVSMTLGATLSLFHSPQALWTGLGYPPDPRAPTAHDRQLADAILHTIDTTASDPGYDDIFSRASAMEVFLSHHGCDYCRRHRFPALCQPDYTADFCSVDANLTNPGATAKAAIDLHAFVIGRRTAPAFVMRARSAATQAANQMPACHPAHLTPSDDRILGIDLSHHDKVDWDAIGSAGVAFVYLKASAGSQIVDPLFLRVWADAKRRNLLRGAYHTLSAEPADVQASLFLRVLANAGTGPCDLAPALDIEPASARDPAALSKTALQWLALIRKTTGRMPVVYVTNGSFTLLGGPKVLGAYPLWLGDYSALASPQIPAAWTRYRFRQFSYGSGPNSIEGLPYDTSEFDGSPQQLLALVAR